MTAQKMSQPCNRELGCALTIGTASVLLGLSSNQQTLHSFNSLIDYQLASKILQQLH